MRYVNVSEEFNKFQHNSITPIVDTYSQTKDGNYIFELSSSPDYDKYGVTVLQYFNIVKRYEYVSKYSKLFVDYFDALEYIEELITKLNGG